MKIFVDLTLKTAGMFDELSAVSVCHELGARPTQGKNLKIISFSEVKSIFSAMLKLKNNLKTSKTFKTV